MKQSRAKSVDRAGNLPPAVSQAARERAEALRKAYGRPKTAFKNSRPDTGNYNLPPAIQNGRSNLISSQKKGQFGAIKRSQSESRSLLKLDYGRDPSRERLDDLRDELHQTKKKMAEIEIEKKKLQTQMHRVMRDSEQRERYLERLVTSKFQPAEMNDTHMARTLTSIQRNQITNEQVIEVQSKELNRLRKILALMEDQAVPNLAASISGHESVTTEQSDYPEEPSKIRTNGILKNSAKSSKSNAGSSDDKQPSTSQVNDKKTDKKKEKQERVKQKLAIAKAYAEQNEKLRAKLKELKSDYMDSRKSDEIKRQAANQENVAKTMAKIEALSKEKEELMSTKHENEGKIENLNQELREAYGEIDALKIDNEKLQNMVMDLESRVENAIIAENEKRKRMIEIPRLDMTIMNSIESSHYNGSLNSQDSIDTRDLSTALSEILGSHHERKRILAQLKL